MIADRKPYRMLYESHERKFDEANEIERELKEAGVDTIRASSKGNLSKYYGVGSSLPEPIYVIDLDNKRSGHASKIEDSTQVFSKYEETRKIDRIYVARESYAKAQDILVRPI